MFILRIKRDTDLNVYINHLQLPNKYELVSSAPQFLTLIIYLNV